MSAPEGYIQVAHGRMTVNIPRSLFKGAEAELDAKKAEEYGELLLSRYPWLKPGSLEVIYKNARREMLRVLDEETGGRNESIRMENKGDLEGAIRHLRKKLEEDPEDSDTWMALGNLLCKAGRAKEGYEAINRARSLY
ncbi:MAG: tetratricopeptide repeat protein [archaeon]|nr:tetratricopeptide repeat protein [archaeon]